jgi:hypothetical protein
VAASKKGQKKSPTQTLYKDSCMALIDLGIKKPDIPCPLFGKLFYNGSAPCRSRNEKMCSKGWEYKWVRANSYKTWLSLWKLNECGEQSMICLLILGGRWRARQIKTSVLMEPWV